MYTPFISAPAIIQTKEMCVHIISAVEKIITLAFTLNIIYLSNEALPFEEIMKKGKQDTLRKCETTCKNQTEHRFDYPLTGSLSW